MARWERDRQSNLIICHLGALAESIGPERPLLHSLNALLNTNLAAMRCQVRLNRVGYCLSRAFLLIILAREEKSKGIVVCRAACCFENPLNPNLPTGGFYGTITLTTGKEL
jgi:hypothetical protein